MNLNFDWITKAARGAVAFSKKNLPSIMIGASIAGFWASVFLIAKDAPKAKAEIEDAEVELDFKDKAIIYGKHCWPGIVTGVASTGLAIGAHKIDLSRLAEMYMLTQFYKEDGEKLKKQILKQENGEKELDKLKKAVIEEKYPESVVDSYIQEAPGEGGTLFIDTVTGARWKGNIVEVAEGLGAANEFLRDDYKKAYKRMYGGPFGASEGPHADEYAPEVYGSLPLDEFLDFIGCPIDPGYDRGTLGIGNLLEFRCYSDSDLLKAKQVLYYKPYILTGESAPKVCFLDYQELLGPSSELLERYP